MQHTFCLSLPLFSPTTTLFCRTKTSNFLVTCYYYGGIVVCAYPIFCLLCSFSLLFFTATHFHLAGHQHLSLSHRHFEFSCFLPTKFTSFVFNHSLQLFPWDACGIPTVKIRFGCTQNCKASQQDCLKSLSIISSSKPTNQTVQNLYRFFNRFASSEER